MEPLPPQPDEQPIVETAPKKTGWIWTSWAVILLGVAGVIGARMWPMNSTEESDAAPKPNLILELQARYIIGLHRWIAPYVPNLYEEAQGLNRGNIEQRLSFIVMAGEMVGPQEALERLDVLDQLLSENHSQLTPSQARVRNILRRLYADYAAGRYATIMVGADDRAYLGERLGWLSELALHPRIRVPVEAESVGAIAGSALRVLPPLKGREDAMWPATVTAIALLGATSLGLALAVLGLCFAFGFVVYAVMGMVIWRLQTGIAHGGVYAETFALWLLVFFGASVGIAYLPMPLPRLSQALITMPTSLLALGWPMIRGVSWRQMRLDIGLTCERNPFVEFAAGVFCYIANLPLVVLGLAITVGLMKLQGIGTAPEEGDGPPDFSSESMPSHPIVHVLADADWLGILQIFLLASVVAPIVEEIMFRGVLHRHCRELTGRWRPFWSALASTTVVSFIFAAVHPQGLTVIPPLMFMAFGFSLAREWRGSLLPSMFAHGMSNGIVLTVALFALSK